MTTVKVVSSTNSKDADVEDRALKPPEEHWLLSRLTLMWIAPLVWKGSSRPLTVADLPRAPRFLHSDPLLEDGARIWDEECKAAAAEGRKPRLLKAMGMGVAGQELTVSFVMNFTSGLFNSVARPLLLRYAVRALNPYSASTGTAVALAAALVGCLMAESYLNVQGRHLVGNSASHRIGSAVQYLIARKAIALQAGAANEGKETTLFGKDIGMTVELARILAMIELALGALLGGLPVLFWTAGASGLVGLAVMLSVFVLSGKFARRMKGYQATQMKRAERTTQITREIIDGAKVVKMMRWEEAYLQHITDAREAELVEIKKLRLCQILIGQLGRGGPNLAVVVTCVVYAYAYSLRAEVVLPIVALFQALRIPFIALPFGVQVRHAPHCGTTPQPPPRSPRSPPSPPCCRRDLPC